MSYALYAAASGMAAQQRSLEVVAENLANVSTPGYQPLRPVFADVFGLQLDPAAAPGLSWGVRTLGERRLDSRGALQVTGDPYDLALAGPGFFRLQRPDGTEVYSRAGHFHPDAIGRLVNRDGLALLGDSGPITIPAGTVGVKVAADGTVTAAMPGGQTQAIGRISLAVFPDPGALAAAGDVLTAVPAAGQPRLGPPSGSGESRILQGSQEDSGVEMVREMSTLLQAQRLYELNARALQAADEMEQMANNVRR